MRLRKRIERHPAVTGGLGRALAAWVRFCARTTRWERRGEEALAAALGTGPVVLVLWHERLALAGVHWRGEWGPISALHTTRFAGRVAGAMQGRVGVSPIAMASRSANLAASREVMRRVREGTSVALTADGPQGPARVLKDAPLDWARATRRPVFVYAFATSRQRQLATWDRMIWPLPFGRGAAIWRLWREELPRRADAGQVEEMRAGLAAALDAAVAEVEGMVR